MIWGRCKDKGKKLYWRYYKKTGPATVFDDVRSFKNFLGTLDLFPLEGGVDDLTMLKGWINKYWAIENESIYSGTQL